MPIRAAAIAITKIVSPKNTCNGKYLPRHTFVMPGYRNATNPHKYCKRMNEKGYNITRLKVY